MNADCAVTATSVVKSFGDQPVLRGVSFSLGRGEIVGLVGPSGSGKSVLLKLLGGIIEPDTGSIELSRTCAGSDREDSTGAPESYAAVGYLFQEGALFDSMSVIENVVFPLTIQGDIGGGNGRNAEAENPRRRTQLSRTQAYELGFQLLNEVGLGREGLKFPGQLSGGMRRRVALARALVAHPELVLLDDPTAGLDPVAASVIVNLILKFHRAYRPTVVLVSQDIRRLLPNVERVIALFEGQIIADLPPRSLVDEADPRVVSFLATRYDFAEQR